MLVLSLQTHLVFYVNLHKCFFKMVIVLQNKCFENYSISIQITKMNSNTYCDKQRYTYQERQQKHCGKVKTSERQTWCVSVRQIDTASRIPAISICRASDRSIIIAICNVQLLISHRHRFTMFKLKCKGLKFIKNLNGPVTK